MPGEADEVSGAPVQYALKSPAMPTGHVNRGGLEADSLGDLVEQFQGMPARTVPLVDHRQDRDAAVAADLEQLEGLRFQTLGRVDQHDRAVDGAEHPVGVLGEVGVAGGVEQVDDAVLPVRGV